MRTSGAASASTASRSVRGLRNMRSPSGSPPQTCWPRIRWYANDLPGVVRCQAGVRLDLRTAWPPRPQPGGLRLVRERSASSASRLAALAPQDEDVGRLRTLAFRMDDPG